MNAVGIDVSKGKSMVAIMRPLGEVVTAPFEVGHTATELNGLARLMDFIADETSETDPDNACQLKEFRFQFEKMMSVLGERERKIINMRYGFAGEKKSTFAEIGRELGVTRERVRQLEAKAILKLRKTEYYQSVQNFFKT